MMFLLLIVLTLVIAALAAWVYLLPGKIALNKNYPKTGLAMCLNIALGWTIIGWLVTFIWALAVPRRA